MKQHFIRSLVASCALLAATSAFAVNVIDQNQPNAPVYMAQFGQTDLAQSFKQSGADITGAGIFLEPGQGTTGTITISLYDSLGGTLLASGSGAGTAGSWVDVFWSAVSVTSGTTYFLVFDSSNSSLGISGDTGNPYAHGQVYANPGFGSFPDYDYTFRTYNSGGTASVPDGGSTMAFLGLGIVALGTVRRKLG